MGETGPGVSSTEEFLQRFFGPGNDAARYPAIVGPLADSVRRMDDAPAVLPRFIKDRDYFALYVIAPSPAQVMPTADLIDAFAGPTYCAKGDTVPADLDLQDPVDAAVIDYVGVNRTFVVQAGPNAKQRALLRTALSQMQRTVAARPARLWRVTRPLGRLLADFDAALAAGGEAASLAALDQIAAQGGITATNLAHLRIKRLDCLGRSNDLLAMDGLAHVLRQDPPLRVKEAVLNAVYSSVLEDPLRGGDVPAACARLRDTASPLPLPIHDDIAPYADYAAATLVTAAIGRHDLAALAAMSQAIERTGPPVGWPAALWPAAHELLGENVPNPDVTGEPGHEAPDREPSPSSESQLRAEPPPDSAASPVAIRPGTWPSLWDAAARNVPAAREITDEEEWRSWPSPAESDAETNQVMEGFDDASWDRAWQIAGLFIQAVGYDKPAPRTARALITYALTFDRLNPGDLIVIQALSEIFLRSSPAAPAYRDLLAELGGSCSQWVSAENALAALDLADRLVLSACPDPDARTNLAISLLAPLQSRQSRLGASDLAFARQLSGELSVDLDWAERADQPEGTSSEAALAELPELRVLLYSLDEAVLDRTEASLKRLAPRLKIATSHDKFGTESLRSKSRNADVVVLATRCAKHAATGFIAQNAGTDVITYADGSGSASLLRAAADGLQRAASR
jgi:hypothetical protein